jgi:hypothetical protein
VVVELHKVRHQADFASVAHMVCSNSKFSCSIPNRAVQSQLSLPALVLWELFPTMPAKHAPVSPSCSYILLQSQLCPGISAVIAHGPAVVGDVRSR